MENKVETTINVGDIWGFRVQGFRVLGWMYWDTGK